MLRTLHIKNFAIVDELTVELHPGLLVFTGETGAGKSILIGAIRVLLGERASGEMVRTGEKLAVVEGLFAPDRTRRRALLDMIESETGQSLGDDAFWLRREIPSSGSGRCFIGDAQIPWATLRTIGRRLAELCGQHAHQGLLDPVRHVEYVDLVGGTTALAAKVAEMVDDLRTLRERVEKLARDRELRRLRREEIARLVAEIDVAGITPGEDDRLLAEVRVVKNARQLAETAEEMNAAIAQDDESLTDALGLLRQRAEGMRRLDERWGAIIEALSSAESSLDEATRALTDYAGSLDFDPAAAERLEERLGVINALKQQHGPSCEAILLRRDELAGERDSLQGEDNALERAGERITALERGLLDDSAKLSDKRTKTARKLAIAVNKELPSLAMADAALRVEFQPPGSDALVIGAQELVNGDVHQPQRRDALTKVSGTHGPSKEGPVALTPGLPAVRLAGQGSPRTANDGHDRSSELVHGDVHQPQKKIARTNKDVRGARPRAPRPSGQVSIGRTGCERIEFTIETNPKEGFKPLAKIASGGELSRVYLALKTVVSRHEPSGMLVFDEVDAGIGGAEAAAVGKRLSVLAETHQIVVVSHLQQMATRADRHYKVDKDTQSGRARVTVRELTDDDRVREIARLVAGAEVTDGAVEFAAELAGKGRER